MAKYHQNGSKMDCPAEFLGQRINFLFNWQLWGAVFQVLFYFETGWYMVWYWYLGPLFSNQAKFSSL